MRALAVVAAGLVLAGAAAAATSSEPKKDIIPAVQAKAKAINVKLSDLPKALWTQKPAGNSGNTPRCSYYNPKQSDLTENGDASSPQFTLPSASYISSNTSIFESAAQGRTAYARVIQPKLPLCLAQLFKKGAGTRAKVTILSATARSFPNVAERTNAYRIAATITVSGTQLKTVADFVVFNRGKVDTVMFFIGIGGSFNDSLERSIAVKVATRAKNA